MSTPENYVSYKAKPGNKEKLAARTACSVAIRKGALIKQPCEDCGEANSEAHHDDYSKPLDVRWLCKSCHARVHRGPRATQCSRGHDLTGSNVRLSVEGGLQKRRCRICKETARQARIRRLEGQST